MTGSRASSSASPTQRGLVLSSGGRSSAPRRSPGRRPIVDLSTGRIAGWTIDHQLQDGLHDGMHDPGVDADQADDAGDVERLVARLLALGGPDADGVAERDTTVTVVPWSAIDDTWVQLDPTELRRLADAGVVVQLPPTWLRGEFEIAAHLLAVAAFPACLLFDGREATIGSMRRHLDLRVVRCPPVPARGPGIDALQVHPAASELEQEGVMVVVDGIADDHVAAHLVRSGIRFGQGPLFDRLDP